MNPSGSFTFAFMHSSRINALMSEICIKDGISGITIRVTPCSLHRLCFRMSLANCVFRRCLTRLFFSLPPKETGLKCCIPWCSKANASSSQYPSSSSRPRPEVLSHCGFFVGNAPQKITQLPDCQIVSLSQIRKFSDGD